MPAHIFILQCPDNYNKKKLLHTWNMVKLGRYIDHIGHFFAYAVLCNALLTFFLLKGTVHSYNALGLGYSYTRQKKWPSLVLVMACPRFGAYDAVCPAR